jgi:DNA repair exonuclease SbcCD ATPase subunit
MVLREEQAKAFLLSCNTTNGSDGSRWEKNDVGCAFVCTDLCGWPRHRGIVAIQRDVDRLVLSIEDADVLIADLEKNLIQIGQSHATRKVLGPLTFSFCPSCLSPIKGPTDARYCHLCKSELDEAQDLTRYARLRNELEMQLKESRELQRSRQTDRGALEEKLGGLQRVRSLLSEELLDRSRHYLTETDAKIDALTKSVGYLERELIDIDRERRLATEVTELAARKQKLNSELSELRSNIAAWIATKEQRQSAIYGLISRITAEILEGCRPEFGWNSMWRVLQVT